MNFEPDAYEYVIVCIFKWRNNGRDGVKSPASRLWSQLFVQAQTNENIKVPLWEEIIGNRWIPRTKGQ